jgi:hypothetical protein
MNTRLARLAAVLLLIALLCSCDRPRSSPQSASEPVLVLERSGGIAGFMDHLVVGFDGQYYLSQQQKEYIGSLSADSTAWLREQYNRLAPFTLRLEDNPGGPDNMVRQVAWTGLGKQVATQAEQQELLRWGTDLLASLVKGQ